MNNIDSQWQADLADMQQISSHNRGYKYILTVIDILSRFAWAEPLKSKRVRKLKMHSNTFLAKAEFQIAFKQMRGRNLKIIMFTLFLFNMMSNYLVLKVLIKLLCLRGSIRL